MEQLVIISDIQRTCLLDIVGWPHRYKLGHRCSTDQLWAPDETFGDNKQMVGPESAPLY